MVVIIVFDNAAHCDNERTYVVGPFVTFDAGHSYAASLKFFHIVELEKVGSE